MIDHRGTDAQQAALERVAARRNSLGILIGVCAPLVFGVNLLIGKRAPRFAVTIDVVILVGILGMLVYLLFSRCPRCSGWIAIPKCPSCGLMLETKKLAESQ